MQTIKEGLIHTAKWRRETNIDDARNLSAALLLEKLAGPPSASPGNDSLILMEMIQRRNDVWEKAKKIDPLRDDEDVNFSLRRGRTMSALRAAEEQTLKAVGFSYFPESATAFAKTLVKALEEAADGQITHLSELLNSIDAIITAASPEARAHLRHTIDGYGEGFPKEIDWATSARAPHILHSLMRMLDSVSHREVLETQMRPERHD